MIEDNCPVCPPTSGAVLRELTDEQAARLYVAAEVIDRAEARRIKSQFYTLEAAVEEQLSTADAFREGFASGVEHHRKLTHKARMARSFVKPTRWQLLKHQLRQRFDRSAP